MKEVVEWKSGKKNKRKFGGRRSLNIKRRESCVRRRKTCAKQGDNTGGQGIHAYTKNVSAVLAPRANTSKHKERRQEEGTNTGDRDSQGTKAEMSRGREGWFRRREGNGSTTMSGKMMGE